MKTTSIKRAAADLRPLSGAIVLVKSKRDQHNPPTGMRGTIRVYESSDGVSATVKIELDYPQMFDAPAHHRTFVLDDAQVDELIASEHDGVFEITLDEDLNPTK
jgi:hypothetical protein